MAKQAEHKWAFKSGMRAGQYSWRASAKAIDRLAAAVSEINAVRRHDPVLAAEGVVALAERIWPAFEHIDTSSGALGSSVYKTLSKLVPILIAAPADEPARAKWLERLRTAVVEDGVQYLQPISDHFGEIAVYRILQNEHADRDLDMIRFAWADRSGFAYVPTSTITLSCLLEAERYEELVSLLALRSFRHWSDECFAARALVRQGKDDAAIAHAEGIATEQERYGGRSQIASFCEDILFRQGKHDEAYQRYGLPFAYGNTNIALWRNLKARYPMRDSRAILQDLIETRGNKGKWFAAAKTAEFLDIARECAAAHDADPATLIRAARDHLSKDPEFAGEVAFHAICQLLGGYGYDVVPSDIDTPVAYFVDASSQLNQMAWAISKLEQLLAAGRSDSLMVKRLGYVFAGLTR